MTDQLTEVDMLLQPYLPSTRTIGDVQAAVLIKAGQLGGNYLPPVRVYLASDDYVTGCLV